MKILATLAICGLLMAKPAAAQPIDAIERGMIQGGCPARYARMVAAEVWEDLRENGFSAGLILYAEKSQANKSFYEVLTNTMTRGIPVAVVLCYEGYFIEKPPIGAMREIGQSIIRGEAYIYNVKTKVWPK